MPISTDGVLLGAWANFISSESILDIGTGTGLLSLMTAQRSESAQITSIDIEPHAIEAAQHNFEQSPWNDRLKLVEGDVLEHNFQTIFQHIICNPPYFTSGEQTKVHQRAIARHTNTLDHRSLIQKCYTLLTDDGKASFVLPITEGEAFIQIALGEGFYLSRYTKVKPTERKPCHRLLFELSKTPSDTQTSELVIHQNGAYSEAFIELTQDFYLKM